MLGGDHSSLKRTHNATPIDVCGERVCWAEGTNEGLIKSNRVGIAHVHHYQPDVLFFLRQWSFALGGIFRLGADYSLRHDESSVGGKGSNGYTYSGMHGVRQLRW